MTTTPTTSEFALVDIDHVHPHPRNVRRTVTGVDELAASIRSGGLHQPLVVAPAAADDAAGYTLVMGHRRLAAVQSLGWSEVPCVIRYDLDTEAAVLEAMLAENMARTDLTPTEEGDAVQALLDLDVTPAKIAKAIGRTSKHVKDRAQIAGLTEKARTAVDDGQITIADALHLSKLDGNHELAERVERFIGTPNFRYTLEKALAEAEFNRKRDTILDELTETGATITDGPAAAGPDEVRLFLAQRPDDVTDPTVSVYVAEYQPWGGNSAPRVQWVQIRPRAEEDPTEGTTFVSAEKVPEDNEEDTAAEEAREAAARAVREEQNDKYRQERRDRETAQATRFRWLHEKWREGMRAEPGVRERQLRELVAEDPDGYRMASNRQRLAPIIAGPDAELAADDPALDPAGWSLDRLIFAAWWIHIGHDRDHDALAIPESWDEGTVAYLQGLVDDYDYPLSTVEEAHIDEHEAFTADADQPAEDD